MTASHDLRLSLSLADQLEARERLVELEAAFADTVPAARSILGSIQPPITRIDP
jgi:hypothetical protein